MSEGSTFDTIESAIADIRAGRMVIVVDDEDRENEGDFITAARNATPDVVNFMATHGRGLICTPLTCQSGAPLNVNTQFCTIAFAEFWSRAPRLVLFRMIKPDGRKRLKIAPSNMLFVITAVPAMPVIVPRKMHSLNELLEEAPSTKPK